MNQSPEIENIFAVLSIKIIKLRCETNQLGANKFLISTLLASNAQDFKLCLKLFDIYYISITRLPGRYLLDFWPKFLNNSAFENNLSDYILR